MFARDYFEQKILGLLNNTSITAPAKMYVALLKGNPGDSGTATEIAYTGYARQEITFTEPAAASNSHSIENSAQIIFPMSSESAGTVTHIGIYDDASSGNMWLYGALDDSIAVNSGVSPIFQIGNIKFTLSGKISSTYREKILKVLKGTNLSGFTPYFGCASASVDSSNSAEFSGNGYARAAVTFDTPVNLDSGAMATSNTAAISTPYATAQWGVWAWTVVYDAQTNGNPFYLSQRNRSDTIYKGGACGYDIGDLVLTIN